MSTVQSSFGQPELQSKSMSPPSCNMPVVSADLRPCSCCWTLSTFCWGFDLGGGSVLRQTNQPTADLPQPASHLLIQSLGSGFLFCHHIIVPPCQTLHVLRHSQGDDRLGSQFWALHQNGEKGTCRRFQRDESKISLNKKSQALFQMTYMNCMSRISPSTNTIVLFLWSMIKMNHARKMEFVILFFFFFTFLLSLRSQYDIRQETLLFPQQVILMKLVDGEWKNPANFKIKKTKKESVQSL